MADARSAERAPTHKASPSFEAALDWSKAPPALHLSSPLGDVTRDVTAPAPPSGALTLASPDASA